jgi:2-polyprenyl-3-methyl-5-hydroxy-6-metoxy-1,4-benzoquinol methylase
MTGAQTPPQTLAPDSQVELKHREEHFHDAWALSIDPREVLVDESWEAVTSPENRWIRAQLGDLRGKRILDLGCGAGEAAVWFAKQGAIVTASDLSGEFLELVHRVAALHNVTVETHQGDADSLDLGGRGAGAFDIVYAANLLHHVNIDETLERIHRALKPGGKVVTWDPLRHNPAINIYRRMAMGVRTIDEHPLDIRDTKRFERLFTDIRWQCFWFATLWIFMRFYLIERVHPNQDRYWKRIIREHQRLTPIYNRLARLDRGILRAAPFFKRYCWNIAICGTKSL